MDAEPRDRNKKRSAGKSDSHVQTHPPAPPEVSTSNPRILVLNTSDVPEQDDAKNEKIIPFLDHMTETIGPGSSKHKRGGVNKSAMLDESAEDAGIIKCTKGLEGEYQSPDPDLPPKKRQKRD